MGAWLTTRCTGSQNPAWRGDFRQEKGPGDYPSPWYWWRGGGSNSRPSHCEFSPADKAKTNWKLSERKSLSLLKFPHSAMEVVATQPPAQRSMSVPELCHADRRAVPARSRGPLVLTANRVKAQHSSFACVGAAEREFGLISPGQVF